MTNIQRVNVIVQNKELEFLVHDHRRQINVDPQAPNPRYSIGLWADVEELTADQHSIALVVDELDLEEAPRFLHPFDYAHRPDDRFYTHVGLYHIEVDKDVIDVLSEEPKLWLTSNDIHELIKSNELFYDSQSAFVYFKVGAPKLTR